jgi:hypothetical protein
MATAYNASMYCWVAKASALLAASGDCNAGIKVINDPTSPIHDKAVARVTDKMIEDSTEIALVLLKRGRIRG